MTRQQKFISPQKALMLVEAAIDQKLPKVRHERVGDVIAVDGKKGVTPDILPVEQEEFGSGFVWRASADLLWAYCYQVGRCFVVTPGDVICEVETRDFCKMPGKSSLANEYFDLSTGRTKKADYTFEAEAAQRCGEAGQQVFLLDSHFQSFLFKLEKSDRVPEIALMASAEIQEWVWEALKRKISEAEAKRQFKEYVKSFSPPDKPSQRARNDWGKKLGISRGFMRNLVNTHAPSYWSTPGAPKRKS